MLLEFFYGKQLISKPLFKLKIIEMKICRRSQIIEWNSFEYTFISHGSLKMEVATIGLLCLLIKMFF